jgi:cytochrome c oxidase subunit 1
MILRLELYSSGNRILFPENQNFYNLSFTLHGFLMIFFLVMPGLYGGFGNYFVPIFLGAPEVGFPRVNSFSFLLLPVSYGLLLVSTASEFPGGAGWTLYPPLSTSLMSLSPVAVDLIIDALLVAGVSSFFSSLNFFATIGNMRLAGCSLGVLPLFPWGILITAVLLLLTLPILSGALLFLLADLHFNTIYFDPAFGGDPVLYQHFFWFFGHPEVYILIIPAFGILSQVISSFSRKITFGNQSMVLAMVSISVLGSLVWGHHIYTLGLEADTRAYFTAVTMMISLPTGTKVFNWFCTVLGNSLSSSFLVSSSAIFAIIFLVLFTLGGSTGVVLGNAAVDVALHDTYYVIAHFHFVLSLGAVIALFLGLLFFQETIVGGSSFLSSSISRNARFHFLLSFFGINLTFTPMHFLGFNLQPRRIPDFPDNLNSWNFLSSIGSGLTLFSLTILNIEGNSRHLLT